MTDDTNNIDFDTKLMLQAKAGNIGAIDKLYKRNIKDVIRHFEQSGNVNGYSEDLAHEVFIRMLEKAETFRENSTFKAFLNGFIQRVLNEHRRNVVKDSKLAKKKALSQNQIDSFTPEKACLYAEQVKEIEMCKSKLPEKQSQAIELSLDSDLTPETATKKARRSSNKHRKNLTDARNKLKKLINFSKNI